MNFISTNASIIGRSHYNLFYNNQDAVGFYKDKDITIGVVADGCGSGVNSEIGAKLAVDFSINYFRKNKGKQFDKNKFKSCIINFLKNIIKNQQSFDELDFIENYLYFTLFAFIINPIDTHIIYSGDGVYILNNKINIIEQNNRPNYIAKNIFSGNPEINTDYIETKNLKNLLIATDGIIHLERHLHKEKIDNISKLTVFLK